MSDHISRPTSQEGASILYMEIVPSQQKRLPISGKERRKEAVEKQGTYAWNTVAVVQSAGNCYTLTGGDTRVVFRNLLAYLLSNQLLEKKNLVFFTDGAKNIQKQTETYFAFHPYTIILDWYHLKNAVRNI